MIVFDLRCGQDHRFEGWFRSHEDFADQQATRRIACPECGGRDIEKRLSVPNIGGPRADRPHEESGRESELAAMLGRLRAFIAQNCEDVGERFAEEARRIHYGETTPRPIHGVATLKEGRALAEEGIDVLPLPLPPRPDA
ncbi:MAG: DUF1178 family protein [Rhodothalassiaceae bacterium]